MTWLNVALLSLCSALQYCQRYLDFVADDLGLAEDQSSEFYAQVCVVDGCCERYDGWMDGWVKHRWMDGWVKDGWMDRLVD